MNANRHSVMSLYEVSDILPGESFKARDLILEDDPILVDERSATQDMFQWEQFAMRIVNVKGRNIIAGERLPFRPELVEPVVEQICLRADEAATMVENMSSERDEDLEPELIWDRSLAAVLRQSAPLFTEAWLMGTVLDLADAEFLNFFNGDGEKLEFIQVHWPFAEGVTQKQLRDLLNEAPDMTAGSSKSWNWVAHQGENPRSRPKQDGGIDIDIRLEDGVPILGSIELKGNRLEANVNSAERAARLQVRLKDMIGDMISEPIMECKTLEQTLAEHRGKPETDERPSELPPEVNRQLKRQFNDRHYRKILDEPIPMLNGKSPRVAARTIQGREKVAAWLKVLETNEARLQQSNSDEFYDFLWMWQELGVAELRK